MFKDCSQSVARYLHCLDKHSLRFGKGRKKGKVRQQKCIESTANAQNVVWKSNRNVKVLSVVWKRTTKSNVMYWKL